MIESSAVISGKEINCVRLRLLITSNFLEDRLVLRACETFKFLENARDPLVLAEVAAGTFLSKPTVYSILHARHGLKFGVHILRGIPRQAVEQNLPILGTSWHARDVADLGSICRWNSDMYGVDMSKPGGQAYYDSLASMYANWGIAFIKANDTLRPYHAAEIECLHRAIMRSGRRMLLSLSPGPAPIDELEELRADSQMWRIEDDLWHDRKSVRSMASRIENW